MACAVLRAHAAHSICRGARACTETPIRCKRCTAVSDASGCPLGSGKTVKMRLRQGPVPAELPWQTCAAEDVTEEGQWGS